MVVKAKVDEGTQSLCKGEGWMISFEPHNTPVRWDGIFMSTVKPKRLRELKFLAAIE